MIMPYYYLLLVLTFLPLSEVRLPLLVMMVAGQGTVAGESDDDMLLGLLPILSMMSLSL